LVVLPARGRAVDARPAGWTRPWGDAGQEQVARQLVVVIGPGKTFEKTPGAVTKVMKTTRRK